MTITLIVVALASAFFGFVVILMRRRSRELEPSALQLRLQPVYLPALINLLNPEDLLFLEQRLGRADFLQLKRARARSLIDYVWRIAYNAKVLASIGAIYQHSPRHEIAAEGQSLAARAITTRMLALRALFLVWIEFLLPSFTADLQTVVSAYAAAESSFRELPNNPAAAP
jgi:hypothetical protein